MSKEDIAISAEVKIGDKQSATLKVNIPVGPAKDPNADIYCVITAKGDEDDYTPGFETVGTGKGHPSWHYGPGPTPPPAPSKEGWILYQGNLQKPNNDTEVDDTNSDGTTNWDDFGVSGIRSVTNMFDATYNGHAFLFWHWKITQSNTEWRKLFNVAPIPAADKGLQGAPNFDPNHPDDVGPAYLRTAPDGGITKNLDPVGGRADRIHGYVRLGEFQNLAQVGRAAVTPWHNQGHSDVTDAYGDGYMGNVTSPKGQKDIFWRWHGNIIDKVRQNWKVDKAIVTDVSPVAGANVKSETRLDVKVTFDRRVSNAGGRPLNIVGLKSTALTLTIGGKTYVSNGISDIDPTGEAYKSYRFRFNFATDPPTAGIATATLAGTSGYAAKTWTFNYTP